MTLDEIAQALKYDDARIVLAFAFNAAGKTQLCVSYKNATKSEAIFSAVMENLQAKYNSPCMRHRR